MDTRSIKSDGSIRDLRAQHMSQELAFRALAQTYLPAALRCSPHGQGMSDGSDTTNQICADAYASTM